MNIIDKIKNSVEAATGLPFYYDTERTLNVRLDTGVFPAAMLFIVESGAVRDDNAILHERLTIDLWFTTLSDLDFDGLTVERSELDAMKMQAFKWLQALFRSHELRLLSINGTKRMYADEDQLKSAFAVNVTIEEIEGVSKCNFATT